MLHDTEGYLLYGPMNAYYIVIMCALAYSIQDL